MVVETKADIRLVINNDDVKLNASKKGSVEVPAGEVNLMVWLVVGDPGAAFTITLSAADPAMVIKANTGTNPVKSNIPSSFFRGAGFMRFTAQLKGN